MIKNTNIFFARTIAAVSTPMFPAIVSAATFGVTNPIKADDFPQLLELIIQIVIQVGMPVLVLSIIYTGFLFIKAQGQPAGLKLAKDALLGTLIGAAIVLGAYAISAIIQGTVKTLQ